MAEISGYTIDDLAPMQGVLSGLIDGGDDLGASVAVTIEGETVADFWGGWTDSERTMPWMQDTIVNCWSITKTMTCLAALVLVDRGELDLDARVGHYWPEFAKQGKGDVLVKQLLSHTSGVSGWDQPILIDDIYDRERSTSLLAQQAPWWEPGTASGYHTTSQGHLVGEVIRRVSGRTLGEFFLEDIAGPLEADFSIGLPLDQHHRVSPVVPPPPDPLEGEGLEPSSPELRTLLGPVIEPEVANTTSWRLAEIGAANGHGNARAVAKIQAIVANGGTVGGVNLLSAETIDRIFEVQADGIDLVLGIPVKFGIGYALPNVETFPYVPQDGRVCLWGGYGGSMVILDLDRRMTIAYTMNQMAPGVIGGPSATALIESVYRCLS